MSRRSALSASVCREIIIDEIRQHGPLSVYEMYHRLTAVFPVTNYAVFASSLMARRSGLCVIDGVIDTLDRDTPKPSARHEREKVKARFVKQLTRRR